MENHDIEPDPPLTPEQLARIAALSSADNQLIDDTLLANASANNRKVAFIVACTMIDLADKYPEIPDVYYSQRIRALVTSGALAADGNLSYMRYSEVRLAAAVGE